MQRAPQAGEPRALSVNLISETANGLQGHGVHTAFLQTRDALRSAGVDVRINSSEPSDVVHIQTMGTRSFSALLRSRRNAVVSAHIVPQSLVGSFILARFWLPVASAYMRVFYGLAARVVAVSPTVADQLEGSALRTPVRLVPNAIDVENSRPRPGEREVLRARLGVPEERFVVLSVGQIQPRKSIEAFIDAAGALPDATFVWVGGMPFKRLTAGHRRMVRAIATCPPNCMFVGEVPHGTTRGWYAAADCLFFPSMQETFGLVIVEAAAARLPLLLRDLPTYEALFGEGYIAADDVTFTPWLERLRDDTALRAHYAAAATRLAWNYDTARMAERLLEVYGEVVSENAARAAAQRRAIDAARRRLRPAVQWALAAFKNR